MKRADGGLGRRDTAGVLSGQMAVGGSVRSLWVAVGPGSRLEIVGFPVCPKPLKGV